MSCFLLHELFFWSTSRFSAQASSEIETYRVLPAPNTQGLPCHQHPAPQWALRHHQWTNMDIESLRVRRLSSGSLSVLRALRLRQVYNGVGPPWQGHTGRLHCPASPPPSAGPRLAPPHPRHPPALCHLHSFAHSMQPFQTRSCRSVMGLWASSTSR